MAPRMKSAAARASSDVTIRLDPDELDVMNAYCAVKGWSRTFLLRRLIRKLPLSDTVLSEEASRFRRLQKALPPLED